VLQYAITALIFPTSKQNAILGVRTQWGAMTPKFELGSAKTIVQCT